MTSESASIDDLLGTVEEVPARPRRRRSGPGWWLGAVLIAGAGTAVTVFGLYLFDIGVPAVPVFAGLLALQLLSRVTRRVAPEPGHDPGAAARVALASSPDLDERDALRSAVNRWEVRLSSAKGDPDRFARTTWPAIVEIADERLRQRHGVTLAGDPQRARALLGEAAWSLLSNPPKRTPTPRDLAAIVAQLEKA